MLEVVRIGDSFGPRLSSVAELFVQLELGGAMQASVMIMGGQGIFDELFIATSQGRAVGLVDS